MDFEDLEESAEQELKRADHLLYVTLKYTRTAEVIKNTIKRLINAYDFAILEVLKSLKVKNVSDVPRERSKQLIEKIPKLKKDIDLYLTMKNIDAASFTANEEYRKNVILLTSVMNVNVIKLTEFFQRTVAFVKLIEDMTKKKK